jgi:hypothetical protein
MQIRFSFQTKYGLFSDALNLPDDHQYDEYELEEMKKERRDKWILHKDNTQIDSNQVDIAE